MNSMTIEDSIGMIQEVGIVPVLRAPSGAEASRAAEAIIAGGIPILEITMTVPEAPAVIRRLRERWGEQALIGAGTVVTADQAQDCIEAGAQFLVSPGMSLKVWEVGIRRSTLVIPGALTPTEIMSVSAEGARLIKVFPCGSLGGPSYLKALRGPFPGLSLIPTGGVNATNAAEFIAAGAFALGIGSELVDLAALRAGKPDIIAAAARELVDVVQSARRARAG